MCSYAPYNLVTPSSIPRIVVFLSCGVPKQYLNLPSVNNCDKVVIIGKRFQPKLSDTIFTAKKA